MNGYNSDGITLESIDYTTIVLTQMQGGVTIRINRPQAQNAINGTLLKELKQVLALIEKDSQIKVLLEGDDNLFCTGMDCTHWQMMLKVN